MEQKEEARLKSLIDAREILMGAYVRTIGIWAVHDKVWHAIEWIDMQVMSITARALMDEI